MGSSLVRLGNRTKFMASGGSNASGRVDQRIDRGPTTVSEFYGAPGADVCAHTKKPFICASTGEIAGPSRTVVEHARAARARRFDLLSVIRSIYPSHRTASCMWSRVSQDMQIQVVRDVLTLKARYSGLRVCGSIWTCPVCAAKISERRAAELAQAITQARNLDIEVALLTVTVPHVRGESLADLLAALRKAWRSFTSGGTSGRLRRAIGLVGTIRHTEVTYGENGWHPHFHCLMFFRGKLVDLEEIQRAWGEHWQKCAVSAGLREPSTEHGLTIQPGDYAARYVSKWGLEHEMTKSMAKKSRVGGRTPFDIADDFADGKDVEKNAALWREYATAFKGQRQLYWSAGLKKLLVVEDKTDEEVLAEEEERPAQVVVQLTWPEWTAIRLRHRATLLMLAEESPHLIRGWLNDRVEASYKSITPQPEPTEGESGDESNRVLGSRAVGGSWSRSARDQDTSGVPASPQAGAAVGPPRPVEILPADGFSNPQRELFLGAPVAASRPARGPAGRPLGTLDSQS